MRNSLRTLRHQLLGMNGGRAPWLFLFPGVAAFLAPPLSLRAQQFQQPWRAMPIVSAEMLDAGISPGGEGCQWPRALAASLADPDFLMMGTDVGGIYRSLDGGKNWQVCMVGWNSRGGNAFALDPKNASRLLGVGGNGGDLSLNGKGVNGVYLSTDQGASWKQVLPMPEGKAGSLAFDPSSFDPKLGGCRTAYYLNKSGGLYKSTDGGANWEKINDAIKGWDSGKNWAYFLVAVHPVKGFVYVTSNDQNTNGFYKSTDGGKTFANKAKSYTLGLSVSPAEPDAVWISRWDGVLKSSDSGETFQNLGREGLQPGKPIENITVSPADPQHLVCWIEGDNYQWVRSFSRDGGKTWNASQFNDADPDMRKARNSTMPYNVRNGIWAWHAKDPNVLFGIGGDWITKSTDGGAHFTWNSNGYNAIMCGGMFNLSPTSPNTVCIGFQDYNASFTLDGGRSWNYRDASGKGYGGYCYGGYAVDGEVMWVGDADHWGEKRRLKVSRDGGKTWNLMNDAAGQPCIYAGADASYSDPRDVKVLFAANWRSADKGRTWAAMPGCEGVFTANPGGDHEIYGRSKNAVVRSDDHGVTWKAVTPETGDFRDLAFDHQRRRFYVAVGEKLQQSDNGGLWKTLEVPRDQFNNSRVDSVAVDPVDTNVVYAAGSRDVYATSATVSRSTDGGATWTNLTVADRPLPDGRFPGGPHEVQCVRVHPKTRELWAAGQCFGLWRMAAPGKTLAPAR